MTSPSLQRPQALSYPARAYLAGLTIAVVAMLATSLSSGLFAPGKLLLALALATLPQLVLGRALDWRPVTHATHEYFSFRAGVVAAREEFPQHKEQWKLKFLALGEQRMEAMWRAITLGLCICGFTYAILIGFPW